MRRSIALLFVALVVGPACADDLVASTETGVVHGPDVDVVDAHGPDFYRVHGVSTDSVLNIRERPDLHSGKVGKIPRDGRCLRNLGCVGGLTFQEFTTLSKAGQQQLEHDRPRWCKIEYRGVTGWVAGRYLREGYCQTGATDVVPAAP